MTPQEFGMFIVQGARRAGLKDLADGFDFRLLAEYVTGKRMGSCTKQDLADFAIREVERADLTGPILTVGQLAELAALNKSHFEDQPRIVIPFRALSPITMDDPEAMEAPRTVEIFQGHIHDRRAPGGRRKVWAYRGLVKLA